MADRATHQRVAVLTGTATGFFVARELEGAPWLARITGTIAAAKLGGALPDILEPGIHSWHRGSFHSLTALLGSGHLMVVQPSAFRGWITGLDKRARRLRAEREALPPDHPDQGCLMIKEMLSHFLTGAAVGLVAGYASHLLLDARTPRGLPLL